MTAELHSIKPGTSQVNATISRTMESLRTYVGMSVPELQRALGLKPGTYFNRKNGSTDWTAAEVKRAADALGVSVATLYDGLSVAGAGFEPATSGLRAPVLSRSDFELAA